MKRIVVKIGSNVLTRADGKLDITRMSAIVDQTVWLRNHGYEVILVTAYHNGSFSLPSDRSSWWVFTTTSSVSMEYISDRC